MTKKITSNFKVNTAAQLKESISEADGSTYYLFAGRNIQWDLEGGSVTDSNPPSIDNSYLDKHYNAYDHMIFGKKLSSNEIKHAVRRYTWTSGTVYTMYDHTEDLTDKNYFVVVDDVDGQHSVFKCLDNNNGSASTQKPSIADLGGKVGASNYTNIYQTVEDGYIWKYMYGIQDSDFSRFSSQQYIPIEINANVQTNSIEGSIDAIKVLTGGNVYDRYHTGYFREVAFGGDQTVFILGSDASSVQDFYTGSSLYIPSLGEVRNIIDHVSIQANPNADPNTLEFSGYRKIQINQAFSSIPNLNNVYNIVPKVNIAGDGNGASARAVVNTASNTISQVVVVSRGTNYTHADVTIPNLSTSSLSSNASCRAILSPPGGHGNDQLNELDASQLIFSVKFANNENQSITVLNDYRQIGLLKDPLYANVEISYSDVSGGGLTDGRYLRGATSNAYGEIISINSTDNSVNVSKLNKKPQTGETMNEETAAGVQTGVSITVGSTITSQGRNTISNDTFQQTTRLITTKTGSNDFELDQQVTSNTNILVTANGYIQQTLTDESENLLIDLTNTRGIFQPSDQATGGESGELKVLLNGVVQSDPVGDISSVVQPDLLKNYGEVLYLENVPPITRSDLQTEIVNLVIKF